MNEAGCARSLGTFAGMLCLGILLSGPAAQAWGPTGHRIIGWIADQHLEPGIQRKIQKNFNIKSLANVANWADEIRKERDQGPWHYTNIPAGKRIYRKERDCPTGECVIEKIRAFSKILVQPGASQQERKDAIKYLVHLVGDVHQPLHLGYKRDRGGNRIGVIYAGEKSNLHAFWDGEALLSSQGKSLLQYARDLNRRISPREAGNWRQTSVEDWANESRSLVLDHAYRPGGIKKGQLTSRYIEKSRKIIDRRLSQAGIRLAHLINTLY